MKKNMKIKPKKAPCICIKDNQLSQDICPVHSRSDKCLCNFHGLKNNACPVHAKPTECMEDCCVQRREFGFSKKVEGIEKMVVHDKDRESKFVEVRLNAVIMDKINELVNAVNHLNGGEK